MNAQTSLFFLKGNEVSSEGSVRCPNCNSVISPDDFSNTAYEVLEAVVNKRGTLENVRVRCLVCKSEIVIMLK